MKSEEMIKNYRKRIVWSSNKILDGPNIIIVITKNYCQVQLSRYV